MSATDVRAAFECPQWCEADHGAEVIRELVADGRSRQLWVDHVTRTGEPWDGRWTALRHSPRHEGRTVIIPSGIAGQVLELHLESMPEVTDGSGIASVWIDHNGDSTTIPVAVLSQVVAAMLDLAAAVDPTR